MIDAGRISRFRGCDYDSIKPSPPYLLEGRLAGLSIDVDCRPIPVPDGYWR
jgi:hypothetical protein